MALIRDPIYVNISFQRVLGANPGRRASRHAKCAKKGASLHAKRAASTPKGPKAQIMGLYKPQIAFRLKYLSPNTPTFESLDPHIPAYNPFKGPPLFESLDP